MSFLPADPTLAVAVKNKLSKLARKRLERFATLYTKALVSDVPEVIHDLRVASRRLQQVLRLLAPKTKSSAKLVRVLRRVRRALGACRNLDVGIHLIQTKLETATSASLCGMTRLPTI